MLLSSVWLLGLPGDWLLDDFSLLEGGLPSLLRPRPLTYLTFWLNYEIAGPVAWVYRFTNILLHAVAVQYCYRALRKLVGEERALLAAAVFALHPLQADAVLYVFSRPVVLMGLLLWVALEKWLEGKHWWAVLFYGLALTAKEEAVAFGPFLILLHLSISKNAKEWRPIGVMLGMAVLAVGGVALAARGIAGSGAGGQAGVGWLDYLATQPLVLWTYLKLSVWPQFPGMRWDVGLVPKWGLFGWGAMAVVLFGFRKRFERAGVLLWVLGALVFLLPTSSVFPLADLAASRRMYMPLALLGAALPVNRWLWVIVLLLAAVAGNWSYTLYRDPEALWRVTMAKQPGAVAPLLQYTKYVPVEKALQALQRNPAPGDDGYQTELGRVMLELGRPAEALRAFGKALAIEPTKASNVYNRGVALAALGQREAAVLDFRRALAMDPQHKPAREALAILKN